MTAIMFTMLQSCPTGGRLRRYKMNLDANIVIYLLGLASTWGAVMWRISALEKKVDKHNSMVERTYKLEGQVKELQHEVYDMKGEK